MAKNEVSVDITIEEKAALQALTQLTKETKKAEKETVKSFAKMDIAIGTFAGNLASNLVGKGVSAAVSGMRTLINVGQSSIQAAMRQEDSINALNAAMRQNGNFSEEASAQLREFAREIQNTTKFGDEATLEQLAFAQSMGATIEQSKNIVRAATDMSEALGMDFNSAVRNITKTLGGLKGELGESIPELGALTQAQLRAGEAIDLVAAKFRGQAAAASQTFSGALTQTQNIIGDTSESLGTIVTTSPVVIKAMQGVGDIFDYISKIIEDNSNAIQKFAEDALVGGLVGGIRLAVDGFIFFNDALTTTQNFMDFVADSAISVGQEIMRFAQVGIEAASAFYSAFGKDTSPLDGLNQDIQKNIELLEENKQKRIDDINARTEENEQLKALAQDFADSSVQILEDRLSRENEVRANARQQDLENANETAQAKKDQTLMTERQIIEGQKGFSARAEKIQEAERKTFQYEAGQKVSIAQNTANLINAIAGEQTKAGFLISKIAAAGQVLIADSQARGAAAAAAATASIIYGPAAPAKYAAILAGYQASITANTAIALGTIAAQTIQGFAQGGFVGGATGASMGPDNTLATLREGELVLTAEDQEALLGGIRGGGMGGDVVVQIDGREIARAVRDQRQQGFAI